MKSILILTLSVFLASILVTAEPSPALKIHPRVFEMIESWLSDCVSPVVTEINLDAVAADQNQFNDEEVKAIDGWRQWNNPADHGFVRYQILSAKGNRYRIEFQQNGGGSLTMKAVAEVAVEKRNLTVNGKENTIRVLRVYSLKSS